MENIFLSSDNNTQRRWRALDALMTLQQEVPEEYKAWLLQRWQNINQQQRQNMHQKMHVSILENSQLKEIYWQDLLIDHYLTEVENERESHCVEPVSSRDDVAVANSQPEAEPHDDQS